MAELTPMERLQPCLLDRLRDDEPGKQQESRDQRVISLRRYRQSVLQDLAWLLNTRKHLSPELLTEFPEAERSVINYGIPELCGVTVSALDLANLERELLRAIEWFEPRIARQGLSIRFVDQEDTGYEGTAVAFEVKGELWAHPLPEALYIRTQFDLETGQCSLEGQSGG